LNYSASDGLGGKDKIQSTEAVNRRAGGGRTIRRVKSCFPVALPPGQLQSREKETAERKGGLIQMPVNERKGKRDRKLKETERMGSHCRSKTNPSLQLRVLRCEVARRKKKKEEGKSKRTPR